MNFKFPRRSRKRDVTKEQNGSRADPTLLETLTDGDRNLHDAVIYYLLLDPRRQIPVLGTAESHYENGLKFKAQGDRISARIEFELAAKIEITKLNMEKTMEYLILADSVSDSTEQIARHRTIMLHLDKVKYIAIQYYGEKKYSNWIEEIPIQAVVH